MSGDNKSDDRESRDLGMDVPIQRRDFLQGAALAILATGCTSNVGGGPQAGDIAAQDKPGYYPPLLTGMRGSHPGSFEDAHAVRDGEDLTASPKDTGEAYDLVVVGGGISGLSAAHFYRAQSPNARILVLDNHDDFGGHAKRNEFDLNGKMHLMNGGTLGIESPVPYSPVADGLMKSLGIHPEELAKACNEPDYFKQMGLGSGVFFDKATFGTDKLVRRPGREEGGGGSREAMAAFLAQTPLSKRVQDDILALETGKIDYMPGKTSAEKKDALSRISYKDYLLNVAKLDPGVVPYYQRRTDGLWGCGIDAVSAADCWGSGLPGFDGLKLAPGAIPRMGYTPRGYVNTGGSYEFHFPDGNASIARLLVRDLVPAAMPGTGVGSIIASRADYSKLDRPNQPVRIRLSSIVIRAMNKGPNGRDGVQLLYRRGGKTYSVRARHCVLASWNMMIPYICPELPDEQKQALHALIKTPLVYTTVALRNWQPFHKLGIAGAYCPGSYHSDFRLNQPQHFGNYSSHGSPDDPILVHMTRTPAQPGLPEREQHKAGRMELLSTPFETFERNIRSQLGTALAGGGFDPARDITAITVNRWPHGYAPENNSLIDPDEGLPIQKARARFGAITIANSDCGGGAYTDVAIDMAHRAVGELLT